MAKTYIRTICLSLLSLAVIAALALPDLAHSEPPYNYYQQQQYDQQQYNQQQYNQYYNYDQSGSSTGSTESSSDSSSSYGDEEEETDYNMQLLDYQIQEFQEHHKKGRELMKRKLFREAIGEFNRAVQLNPYSYETLKYRGIAYKNLKYYKAAAEDLTAAIIEDPNDFETFYNRGVTFYYLKKYPESVTDLSTALQINPNSFNAYFFRGMSHMSMKKSTRAMDDFDRTLALKPSHPWAKEKRAKLIAAARGAGPPQSVKKAAFKFPNIDKSIPRSVRSNPDAIAVIIGNRDYRKAKNVDYAINDVRTMKNYLMITFGFREGNIFHLENATQSEMTLYFGNKDSHKGKLFNAVRRGVSDVFIYYSGHGAPGLKDNRAYFVPVDADPQYIELGGYPADLLYRNLAKVPARSMTVVLDACFSGADIFENISPMNVKVIAPKLRMKNSVVISSSGSGEVSTWLNEQKHGLFTYFFLKGIQDQSADSNRDGSITYEEIFSSLADTSNGVPYFARRLHGVEQSPTIDGSYKDKVLISY